ncbi:alpha/beta hydrolase [Micromonospora sp. WMMA1947]|uniref:alpha/beta fold hydrolase n=1 Tax=Micromonospora sp. WMMA1947 TaxID=3015163 RepID=UPI00248AF0D4|nr:alpha/beta hydrolase [Micromonospora sp. WMMA1947]WBC07489.1 alpha/beta hydrolase [Micromonospora sp. WMMA1947]
MTVPRWPGDPAMAPVSGPVATARQPVRVHRMRPARGLSCQRVLLLNGLAGSPTIWRPFAQRVPAEIELWGAELPWASGGDPRWQAAGGTTTDVVAEALAGVPRGADVVIAHSFAANALLELLCRRVPDRLQAVVLVSPFYRATPDRFDWSDISFYLNNFHRILAEGIRVSAAQPPADEVVERMALRLRERIGPYGWMRFFDAYLRTPFLDLTGVLVPVLVIGGRRDIAVPIEDVEALAQALPAGRLARVAASGHFAMAEHPPWFTSVVQDFLAVNAPPSPLPIVDVPLELL